MQLARELMDWTLWCWRCLGVLAPNHMRGKLVVRGWKDWGSGRNLEERTHGYQRQLVGIMDNSQYHGQDKKTTFSLKKTFFQRFLGDGGVTAS